jgi:serpin B
LHKACVEVDEDGTRASAATGCIAYGCAAVPRKPTVFKADHPFVFLIRDEVSGVTLFIGVLNNPTDKN